MYLRHFQEGLNSLSYEVVFFGGKEVENEKDNISEYLQRSCDSFK